MSTQPARTPLQDDPGQPADPHGYREVLHDLITMGAGFARLLHGQAAAQAQPAQPAAASAHQGTDPQPAPDALIRLSAAFDRTARAVRRGILLARSLDQPVQPAPLQPAPDPAAPRAAARRRILRDVEDAIQRTGRGASDGHDRAETLQAELRDRLDAPDLDWDISTRPIADIISEICRDLGLAPPSGLHPWKRRTPQDIAQLCARAAAPSVARHPGAGPQEPRRDPAPTSHDPQTWAELALEWMPANPAVTCIVPGTSQPPRMAANVPARHGPPPGQEMHAHLPAAAGVQAPKPPDRINPEAPPPRPAPRPGEAKGPAASPPIR